MELSILHTNLLPLGLEMSYLKLITNSSLHLLGTLQLKQITLKNFSFSLIQPGKVNKNKYNNFLLPAPHTLHPLNYR